MMEALRLPQSWSYNLGPLSRIPLGKSKLFAVAATLIAVFRARTGQVFATQATCPHRGGVLADGVIGGTRLVCPLHGFKFDLASGRALGNGCSALKTYPVKVSERGEIKLCLEER